MSPRWFEKFVSAFQASTAHTFTLHGDGVNDYAEATVDLVPWLTSALVKNFDLIMTYDPAQGIQFPIASMKRLFVREVMGEPDQQQPSGPLANAGIPQADSSTGDVPLPREPRLALPMLDAALKLSDRNKPDSDEPYRVLLIFPYAHLVFPDMGGVGVTPAAERQAQAFMMSWARNPRWRAGNAPLIFLIAPQLSGISSAVVESTYLIQVDAPNYDERRSFIEDALTANGVELAEGLTVHRLAAMTAGLMKVHIEDVIVKARVEEIDLTPDMAQVRKDEIMAARFAGILETAEAEGDLSDIAGLDYLKLYLQGEIVDPMKEGETAGVPMGVLMAGPPGTGKTYIAEKLAASAGVNFVMLRLGNLKGSLVGQSQANLERALQGIQSMTPCIVFMDEIEQSAQRNTTGGNSVDSDMFGRMLNAMSDTRNRGKVVWLMATNRPDLLDAAFKRSGRIDAKFAVLPPDNDAERAEMFRVMARKNGVRLDDKVDLEKAAAQCVDYTGADIEVITNKAAKVARREGRKVVSHDDLMHAIKVIRVSSSAQTQRMLALALAEVNDLENLPPSYRDRFLKGEFEDEIADIEEGAQEQPRRRKGRSLDL